MTGLPSFEKDPYTGETKLLYDDGTYFVNKYDYDHGWIWRKPGMKFSQIRRSKWTKFYNRAMLIWITFIFGLYIPWILADAVINSPLESDTAKYLFTVSIFSGTWAFIFWLVARAQVRELLAWTWHGRLYKND